MNDQLQLLIALQKIDSTILAARRDVDLLPMRLAEREAALKQAELRCAQAETLAEDALRKKHDKERELSEAKDRIEKLRNRSSDIKKNAEYQAHLAEVERVESGLKVLDASLLTLAEQVNRAHQEADDSKKLIAQENDALSAGRQGLVTEAAEKEAEIKILKGERKKIVAQLDPDVNDHYMTLMRACRGVAVAEACDEVCQGCCLQIPPQLFVEVKSGDAIETCPQCRRILYYVKPDADTVNRTPASCAPRSVEE